MQGIETPATNRGIIPRTFEQIFESIATIAETKFLVHVSYLEVGFLRRESGKRKNCNLKKLERCILRIFVFSDL